MGGEITWASDARLLHCPEPGKVWRQAPLSVLSKGDNVWTLNDTLSTHYELEEYFLAGHGRCAVLQLQINEQGKFSTYLGRKDDVTDQLAEAPLVRRKTGPVGGKRLWDASRENQSAGSPKHMYSAAGKAVGVRG
jgi:hypothetical protein